jgi:hypothetical protein
MKAAEVSVVAKLLHYPSICLEGLRKSTGNLSHDSPPPD